jgi:hypothetical protein
MSSSPEALPEKNEIEGVEARRDTELQRIQSKMSLAVMMADFPDGGKWAWLSLVGATLVGFCTSSDAWLTRHDEFVRRLSIILCSSSVE